MALFTVATAAAEGFSLPASATAAPVLGGDDIVRASQALTAEVTAPAGMARPFLAHQAAAYAYAKGSIARWGCAFLGDDMGLGKTQVLLANIADAVASGGYAILVGPPVAWGTYETEVRAAFPGLTIAKLHGRTRKAAPAADIYFLSDDAGTLAAWLTDISTDARTGEPLKDAKGKVIRVASKLTRGAAIFVRDEVHRDKGNQGKPSGRAKVSLIVGAELRSLGRPVVVATGTLLVNRPVEGFIPLQIAGGDELVKAVSGPNARSKSHYLFRYCAPETSRFGTSFNGVDLERAGELHDYLRRTVYVRREKSDLGDLLPHSGWVVTPIALNGALGRYQRLEREFFNVILEENGPEAAWRAKRAETITRMQKLWEEAGVAKADAAVEYITDLIDQGRKVIVFFHHRAVRDALALKLGRHKGARLTVIDGSVKGDDRADAEAAIQTGDANVMLANIRAAGMAITLTAASEAVFVQVPWSAGDLAQAAGRIKRADDISVERAKRGEAVTYHVIQATHENGDPTFDHAMWGILEVKAKVCDAVNAGRDITLPDESVTRQALQAWYDQTQAGGRYR